MQKQRVRRAQAGAENDNPSRSLILFVAGDRPNSRIARSNFERLRREELRDFSRVRIVDVLKDYESAAAHNVFLTPALLMPEPPPGVVIVGNLSDTEAVLQALHLRRQQYE